MKRSFRTFSARIVWPLNTQGVALGLEFRHLLPYLIKVRAYVGLKGRLWVLSMGGSKSDVGLKGRL